MAGLRWMVLLGLWAGVVTWYWLAAVPLVPTSSVAHAGDLAVLPQRSGRHVILYHFRSTAPGGGRATGPLEFWDPAQGGVVKTFLSRDDQIVLETFSPGGPDGYVLTRRDGQLVLYELESGQALGTFEDVPKVESYVVQPQQNVLVVNADQNVHCFQFDRPQSRWVLRDAQLGRLVDGDLQVITRVKPSATRRVGSPIEGILVNVETGELDRRFAPFGKIRISSLSPDGKLALLRFGAQISVCSVEQAQILWNFSLSIGESVQFSPDGRELVTWRSTRLGPADVRRRQVDDGAEIVGEPPAELLASLPSGASKYVVRDAADLSGTQMQKWRDALNQFWMKVGLYRMIVARGLEIRLVEAKTGRDLGRLPRESNFVFTEGQNALLAVTRTHIQTYTLPPRRDYGWLAGWIVGPPVVVGRWRRVRGLGA